MFVGEDFKLSKVHFTVGVHLKNCTVQTEPLTFYLTGCEYLSCLLPKSRSWLEVESFCSCCSACSHAVFILMLSPYRCQLQVTGRAQGEESGEAAEVWSHWDRGLFPPCINRLCKSKETCSSTPARPLLALFLSASLPQTIGGAHTPVGDDTRTNTQGGSIHSSLVYESYFPYEFASHL